STRHATPASAWFASRSPARNATATLAIFLMTAPTRPACATASTPPQWTLSPPGKNQARPS
ncbi:uncharacterized protein METZ01_LOCUS216006, partial [marine metagenome]